MSVMIELTDFANKLVRDIETRYKFYKKGGSRNFLAQFGNANKVLVKKTAPNIYVMTVKAPEEWKYVNYGVNGLLTHHGSPMSFKKKGISNEGQRRIRKWMRDNQIVPDARTPGLQKMYRVNKEKALGLLARFVLVPHIKEKGLKPRPFVTDVVTRQRLDNFRSKLVRSFAADMIEAIKP